MCNHLGCGKTELIKTLSESTDSPYIKVEATQYTEVGYHGKDVDTIIHDLVKKMNSQTEQKIKHLKEEMKLEFDEFLDLVIMELLIGHQPNKNIRTQKLKEIKLGYYNHRYVTVPKSLIQNYNVFNSFEEYFDFIKNIYGRLTNGWEYDSKRITVKTFRNMLYDSLIENVTSRLRENSISIKKIENDGIVFIDEIDKIAVTKKNTNSSRSPSTDGVQRDLLPMVEGTMIKTSSGFINTKHILFITAGAFSHSKPEDLLPELLGRL